MERRQLMVAVGSLAVAGCLGGASTSDDEPGTENESPSDGENNEDEPTVDVEATDATLETREAAGGRVETAVTGAIENTGDARLGVVTVAGKFFNADDQLLSSSPWGVRDLAPGEVWEPWVPYTGDGGVERAEITVTDVGAHSRTVSPSGIVVESHDMQIPADDNATPRILGTVANQSGSDVPTLLARPKAIAENGNLLETAVASVQNLGAGESWSFDQQVHFKNPDWVDRIGSYEIVLTA